MVQNTAKVSADNLFIYNPKSFVVNKNHEKAAVITRDLTSSIDFIGSSTVFFYNNRLRLSIDLNPMSQRDFVLLKGLIEFHRPAGFILRYNKDERSLEADIFESDFVEFKRFLKSISALLAQEISFKASLKKVIAFEAGYAAERNALYASLLKAQV